MGAKAPSWVRIPPPPLLTARFVVDEPVRGGYPPPGFYSLSGLEQVRAMSQGLVPRPPFFRLTGITVTHATAGTATLTMPASPWLQTSANNLQISPLLGAALAHTGRTVAPPGVYSAQRKLTVSFMPTPSPDMETFVARGRVVMSGRSRVTVELHVEDALGRLVAHATGQSVFVPRDEFVGEPALPPPRLDRTPEPTYPTPDPALRPLDEPAEPARLGTGLLEGARLALMTQDFSSPITRLLGARLVDVDEGRASFAIRCTEWVCSDTRSAFPILTPLLVATCNFAGATCVPEGMIPVPGTYDQTGVAAKPLFPDGREVAAHATVVHQSDDTVVVDGEGVDAEGRKLLLGRLMFPVAPDTGRPVDEFGERVLATVVFADVVGSTPTVQRLGDASWRNTLETVYAAMRKEIAKGRGMEVATTGDGFLATFDSPARAVQCSRGIRESVRALGLETRIGIHLGEVERVGRDIAGIAVHVAKRVEGAAEADAIFVTSTVRDAAAGSGIRFASRGMHALKGLEDEWHLYSVED